MNKNKGFIGIGLILAIVLGIVVVGGGAYYLGKNSSSIPPYMPDKDCGFNGEKCIDKDKNTQQENQNQPVVENKNLITVLSPNGGEIYKDSDKILIKWSGISKDRIAIYLRFSSGEWCPVKDVPSSNTNYTFIPYGHDCGPGRGVISSGQYKITLISYKNDGMTPEPGTAFAGNYDDGDDGSYGIDSSNNSFTINSTKVVVSTTLPANYIGALEGWPPRILSSSADSYSCLVGSSEMEKTIEKIINGRTYCVKIFTEGAAGSSYVKYTYIAKLLNPNNTKATTFTLKYPSCGVWQGDGTTKYSNCQTEQSTFKANLDNIIDSLMQAN